MIADSILVHICISLAHTGNTSGQLKSLENGAGIFFAAPKVIDLSTFGIKIELVHEGSDVFGMNVISNLLPFIAINFIVSAINIAFDQVAQKAVQLNAGMLRSGETTSAKTTGRHDKVASVFLNHNIGCDF